MKTRTVYLVLAVIVAAWSFGVMQQPALAEDVQRMSIEQLKGMLGQKDVNVYDVRTPRDWQDDEKKIKGAVRLDEEQVAETAAKIDKANTVVFYCA
jgi:hypothetical protein